MKTEASNKLEQLIQSKFENLEISPNPEVWNRIEAVIDENQKVTPIIPFGWSKVILLTAIIAGSFVTGYFVSNYKTENNTISNSNSSSSNLKNEEVLQINQNSINISEKGNTIGSDKISTEKIRANNTNQLLNKKNGNSNGILSSNEPNESRTNVNISGNHKSLEQEDIIPAFEPKLNSKKAKNRKQNIAPLAMAPSNDKATNTGISATTIYEESASKIYVKRNNEMIALEIVGDGQVKITEETKDEIHTEEKGLIDLKEIKKQEKFASGFFVGPSLGLDLATMYFSANSTDPIFNKNSTFSASIGYLFGVSGGYDFNRKLGIQTAVHFSRLNFGFVQPDNDNINKGELSIFQIEIPFLLRYKWNFELGKKNKLFSLVALGGLKYSYITKYFMAARLFSNNASNVAYWHLDKISQDENHTLGYMVGIEANYFFNKNLYFFGGINATVSSDISQFPIFLNNQLEKPTQVSSMINFGMRYQFNKKKKTTR